ncbi:hypothetical protein IW139_004074 [Coemansia sp. RSA 353]|nr:hypothetical protein GGH97_000277 [Coemansia sp. RSA 475]KAJ2275170.1 hypothetical protein GGH14_003881 [Coemansia sp. RSA 370]KAJ2294990.1 hypothetical protein IW139_004074 [Coemansia sp. RSA 353]KAJ2728863.1 hypothetical protein H4S00_000766 [Coemansia sp. D1744]
MDSLFLSSEDTYLLLARQGYAAQGRRQAARRYSTASSRRSVNTVISETSSPTDDTFSIHDSYSDNTQNLSGNRGQTEPIGLPIVVTGSAAIETDSGSSLYDSSPYTLGSPCSPSTRGLLHERFQTQFKDSIIEEEDGEDGMVIYNGLKRLSMTEAGLVMQGRPRIVNI